MTDEDPKASTRWDRPPELREASPTAQAARTTDSSHTVGRPLVMAVGHDFVGGWVSVVHTAEDLARNNARVRVEYDRCRICGRHEPGHPEFPSVAKPPVGPPE